MGSKKIKRSCPLRRIKFLKLLAGITHMSMAFVCASSVLNFVNAEELGNTSIPNQIASTNTEETNVSIDANASSPNGNYITINSDYFSFWAEVSKYCLYLISFISIMSIMVLCQALYLMLTRYTQSVYFEFMTTMIVASKLWRRNV